MIFKEGETSTHLQYHPPNDGKERLMGKIDSPSPCLVKISGFLMKTENCPFFCLLLMRCKGKSSFAEAEWLAPVSLPIELMQRPWVSPGAKRPLFVPAMSQEFVAIFQDNIIFSHLQQQCVASLWLKNPEQINISSQNVNSKQIFSFNFLLKCHCC